MTEVRLDSAELSKLIQDIRHRGESLSHVTPVLADALYSTLEDVVQAEGPGWQDLADSTKKARRDKSYKILQDTGIMMLSLEKQTGADFAEAIFGASYAIFHVTGTKYMAKRDPTDPGPLLPEMLEDCANILLNELTR